MLGRERVKAYLKRIPKPVKDGVARQLEVEVGEFVAAVKRGAPDDPATPGNELAATTKSYPNRSRPLSHRVIVDARDGDGTFIGPKVEHGHRNLDGTHTPARPWFFPTYRARRKAMRRRMMAAGRKILRQLFPR